ncbi:MAG: helix-turn-helix domain-containing protein [Myxococcota bacterium]
MGRLMSRGGASSLGVNAIAREAKVNKSLIYRYFGDLNALYVAYVDQSDLWPTFEELVGPNPERLVGLSWPDILADVMPRYAAALRRRPQTLELLAVELSARTELTIAFEEVRESRSNETFERMAKLGLIAPEHVAILLALVSAAINYLAVRSRNIRWFSGVEINTDEFWTESLGRTLRILGDDITK